MKIDVNNIVLKLLEYCKNESFVVLCLGTRKVSVDSLGCIVGSLLKNKYKIKNFCYGDYLSNVTSTNVEDVVKLILAKHKNEKIIVVDSAFGFSFLMENINVYNHGIVPRGYIERCFSSVGDISILGILGNKKNDLINFNDKHIIYRMADIIAKAIYDYSVLQRQLKYILN